MVDFAQFVAVSDDTFVLPDPQTKDIDVSFSNITLADLDPTRTAVAMFKVGGEGFVRLRMRFNSGTDHFIDFTSTPGVSRTWHEIFPGSDLRSTRNELTVSVAPAVVPGGFGTEGRIRLSDIVILYHASAS